MARIRLAALLGALLLLMAPALAGAAMACRPACCASASQPTGAIGDETDCGAALGLRLCCEDAPSLVVPPAPPALENVAFGLAPIAIEAPRAHTERRASPLAEARLAPRTSSLRFSVVLLI